MAEKRNSIQITALSLAARLKCLVPKTSMRLSVAAKPFKGYPWAAQVSPSLSSLSSLSMEIHLEYLSAYKYFLFVD